MKPSEVAAILQQAPTTIRTWSQEFKDYLSPTAAGGDGRHRDYDDNDIRVLTAIRELKRGGHSSEEIHATLAQMQRDDWRDLPEYPDVPAKVVAPVQMIPAAAAGAALDSERKGLMREIASLQARVDSLENQLTDEQAARRADNERLLRELAEAREQMAELRTLVKLYESGRLKPPPAE
jgi:DNA-binding transcriptional MerR regulator